MRNGPSSTCGGATWRMTRSNSGAMPRSLGPAAVGRHPALLGRAVEDREIELLLGRVERREQVEHLVGDLGRTGVGAIDLVDDHDGPSPILSAFDTTNLVCGSGPSAASTSTNAPSTILRMRSTSPPKSAWPGVSTILIRVSCQTSEVALARMVMPRSRSRSLESSARSTTRWFSRNEPDCCRSRSTSVVLPWSTWAMMAMLRRFMRSSLNRYGPRRGPRLRAVYSQESRRSNRLWRRPFTPRRLSARSRAAQPWRCRQPRQPGRQSPRGAPQWQSAAGRARRQTTCAPFRRIPRVRSDG